MVKKQLDYFDVSLADGFVQGSITDISRRVDVGPRKNQCRDLVHVSSGRSDMQRPLAEIANLIDILKVNPNECGKVLVFVAS